MSKTSTASKDKYNTKAYEQIPLRVKRGEKSIIQARAASLNVSVNSYINNLINHDINRR